MDDLIRVGDIVEIHDLPEIASEVPGCKFVVDGVWVRPDNDPPQGRVTAIEGRSRCIDVFGTTVCRGANTVGAVDGTPRVWRLLWSGRCVKIRRRKGAFRVPDTDESSPTEAE